MGAHIIRTVPPRSCPICLGEEPEFLFRQDFATYSQGGLIDGYDLVVCAKCGGGYASGIPDQEAFDRYYAEMSKYEYAATGGAPDQTAAARFREVVDVVGSFIPSSARIADVGCATGGLLAEFKNRGFRNVIGFDPAPYSASAARRLYDLEVRTVTINRLSQVGDRFDLILLTGVLEHIRDLEATLCELKELLRPRGQLYIEVPDATRYDRHFSAPFQFLSMEHVNFFSPTSLSNLFVRHGLQLVFVNRVDRLLSATAVEPAVAALFALTSDCSAETYQPSRDTETMPALSRYIERSRTQDAQISSVIAELVRTQVPLAVWGTGTHTLRLLETSPLAQAKIVAFLDSNSRYQGKELRGIPIVSPLKFEPRDAAILISSHVAEAEITAQIQNSLHWPNKVICLYREAGTEPRAAFKSH